MSIPSIGTIYTSREQLTVLSLGPGRRGFVLDATGKNNLVGGVTCPPISFDS